MRKYDENRAFALLDKIGFTRVAGSSEELKAAEILKNNQPNITRCMNNLESELGCKLFIRSHQGVTLTAEGEKVYERVAVAYEQLRTVEEELALERSLESGLITIGASETALRLMLLSRLEHFHTRYPHVRLRTPFLPVCHRRFSSALPACPHALTGRM